MCVKERLIEYLKSKNISQSTFERNVGLSNGYVNNIRKSIQPDKIQRIALLYPDLNIGWLMTGNGNMLISEPVVSEVSDYREKYYVLLEENRVLYKEKDKLNREIEKLKNEIKVLKKGKEKVWKEAKQLLPSI
jgi:transcriptional regulator with XRE-family HTH domain